MGFESRTAGGLFDPGAGLRTLWRSRKAGTDSAQQVVDGVDFASSFYYGHYDDFAKRKSATPGSKALTSSGEETTCDANPAPSVFYPSR